MMSIQEILKGESKNVEYKMKLPARSEKYLKSVIAFSNTSGGKILIGVEDQTGKIVGVDEKEVFQIMDTIANAISDSCAPQIIPDISFQTVDSKCLIIVDIYPGSCPPYYLKSAGKENGTYIRIGGTSRLADAVKLKELEIEGANLSWDELVCIGHEVTPQAVDKLCSDILQYARSNNHSDNDKSIQIVTSEQLLSWNILKNAEGKLLATNAFVLLTSDKFHFSRIQCALFKGTAKNVFIDKREYVGPLYEQIESAYQFVLNHINLGAKIEGLVRKESYELPPLAIREMIVNAVCHRNYMDSSFVQVSVFDDRVEVTSPGTLYGGLTLDCALQGLSKIRNRGIAEVFNRMGIIEQWGTGLKRILESAQEYGLPQPDFIELGDSFRVCLYRNIGETDVVDKTVDKMTDKPKMVDKTVDKMTDKPKMVDKTVDKMTDKPKMVDKRKELILLYINQNGQITNKEARDLLNVSATTVRRILDEMICDKILIEEGEYKSRKYRLLEN